MRWGVWFEPVRPAAELVELAVLAEAEGATTCFVADEGTDRDVWITLTAIALATDRLVVAPAITNPFSRHPVASAAAVATLAELVPGRVWHGLGVGGSRVLGPLGLAPARPFSSLRDSVALTRELLAGRRHGDAQLPWIEDEGAIPLAIAGRGPRVQALAADQADWVILSAEPVVRLPEAAARLRAKGAHLAWSAYLAYDDEQRRQVLGHFSYMALDAPPEIRAAAGLDADRVEQVRAAMLAGHLEEAAALLPESLVDHYAVAGSPESCAERIADLAGSFDLFVLPMNDVAGAERHIRTSAAILRDAAERVS
ncbi:MAG TPA: LLM class flavin-dependent oxidoreductase [Acidimicrobiales bacterium]|nr:LLM class flavin-dependent oxidoreductase [Acidimicrobiales bacterium]